MSIALGFVGFLVGLFCGVMCKNFGIDDAVEQMQENCKRCIVTGELKNIKGEQKHE